jgi:hypothetical protein
MSSQSWPATTYHQPRSITGNRYIINVAWLHPWIVSPNSLHYRLHVYLHTSSITSSNCAHSWSGTSYCQILNLTATKSSSHLARCRPRGGSRNFLDHPVRMYRWVQWNTLSWNVGARCNIAHHYHSAAPRVASDGISWQRADPAWGPEVEGDRIWWVFCSCWTSQIPWIIAPLATVHETKSWERISVNFG